jgi:adenosylhomocysteine nucleosidase
VRTLLMVAAEKRELAAMGRHARSWVPLQWPVDWCQGAEVGGRRFLLVANGPGEKLAGEAADVARERESFDAVISTGFCGALNPALAPGDIFVATAVKSADGSHRIDAEAPGARQRYVTGTLVTATQVIQTAAQKRALHLAGADAVDMEAIALGTRARDWGLPFHCVRAVTDAAGEDFATDFNAARDADGRFRTWRILMAALARPGARIPELRRLRRRSLTAAGQLGEFLANCQF